jgi:hypothetical protein
MPDIRVISWNIKDFKSQLPSKKPKKPAGTWENHGNKILDILYDALDVRQFDMFVIVEPYFRSNLFGFGDIVTNAPGLEGVLRLYYALRAKEAGWRVAPLRASADFPDSDMVAVFYFGDVVQFSGPDHIDGVAALTTVTTAPPNQAQPWSAATTKVGQVAFTLANGTAIDFHGRSPYLTTFNTPDRITRDFTLQVDAAGGALAVKTATLPTGAINQPYLFTLQAEGGTPPYVWASAGTSDLPPGVALVGNRLQGTPLASGNFHLDVSLTDAVPAVVAKVINFTIAAAAPGLAFESAANLPVAVAGAPYSLVIGTQGGRGFAREVFHAPEAVAHLLPAGMTLSADGTLDWPLPTPGNHTIRAEVVDQTSARLPIALQVRAAAVGPLAVVAPLPNGVIDQPYVYRLQAEGGTAPYVFVEAVGSNLPAGLAFAAGELTGTPGASGNFALNITLTDNVATTVNAVFNFTIAAAGARLALANGGALPVAVAGQPYASMLTTTGARGTGGAVQHAKTLATDALPVGMVLGPDGKVEWPLPTVGNHAFDVEVADVGRGFKILGAHAPPQDKYPTNYQMVEALATVREITTGRAGMSVAVCGDFNVCPRLAGGGPDATACNSVTLGLKHDASERNALDALALVGYTRRNVAAMGGLANRSSLQSSSNAQKGAYQGAKNNNAVTLDDIGCHAFDHVMTIGFGAVLNCGTINLIAADPAYAAAVAQAGLMKPAPLKAIVKKYVWSDGVSDHLPVRFTLQLP